MDVQADIGHVVDVFAGYKPDDLADRALRIVPAHAGREIEIWLVERESRIYILAEHGYKANWVQNILASPSVEIRLTGRRWQASGRVVESDRDGNLYAEVRELAREKYGLGNGLPIEFRLERQIQ